MQTGRRIRHGKDNRAIRRPGRSVPAIPETMVSAGPPVRAIVLSVLPSMNTTGLTVGREEHIVQRTKDVKIAVESN